MLHLGLLSHNDIPRSVFQNCFFMGTYLHYWKRYLPVSCLILRQEVASGRYYVSYNQLLYGITALCGSKKNSFLRNCAKLSHIYEFIFRSKGRHHYWSELEPSGGFNNSLMYYTLVCFLITTLLDLFFRIVPL